MTDLASKHIALIIAAFREPHYGHLEDQSDNVFNAITAYEKERDLIATSSAHELYRPVHQGYPDPVAFPAMYGGMKE